MSIDTFTATAAADLSGKQYHLVRLSAANAVNQASEAANSGLAGVLTNKPESGEAAAVKFVGLCKVTAGAAITAPAFMTTNGSGRAVAVSSGSEQMAFGRALESAGADGDLIECILFPPIRWCGTD